MTSFSDIDSETFSYNVDFQFGDKRINRRANYMTKKMVKNAEKSLPQIFSNEADLKGAYRFLSNKSVTPKKILQPHHEETIKRCKSQKLVAVLQDSSDLDFDYMECLEGFNPLHVGIEKGFRIHPSLVITEEGTPLGILSTSNYTRVNNNLPKKHRNILPIEEKESFRWLEGYREACKLAEQLPDTKVVSIADREGDIYECLAEAQSIDTKLKADILVRSNHNRSLVSSEDHATDKLEKKLIRSPIIYEGKVVLNRHREEERTATIAIRACAVTMQAPSTYKKKSLAPIEMNAVLISEIDPPQSLKPLDWLLITTLPINSLEEIELIVSLYCKRWCIEVYFKVLKSGCKVDTPRLQTPLRMENFIALAMIVAWKVMLTTYLPREYPEIPCTSLFTEIEWKLAFRSSKQPLPEGIPTLKEIVKLIAILGGYKKRREPPGIQTVWRGVVRLMDMVYGYELTRGIILN